MKTMHYILSIDDHSRTFPNIGEFTGDSLLKKDLLHEDEQTNGMNAFLSLYDGAQWLM
jgi:hypothetical protein